MWEARGAELPASQRGAFWNLLPPGGGLGQLGGRKSALERFSGPILEGRWGKASLGIAALPPPGCATLGKGQTLSGPQLPICKKDNIHFVGLPGRV